MQRAAASTSPSTPQSQSHTLDTLPSKRQKVSAATSSIPTPTSDLQLIQVALTKEEEKKEKAINRLAEEAGETKWVLSTVNGEKGNGVGGLRVANAGYSEIDQEAWRPAVSGRRSFGKFNQELEVSFVIVFNSPLLMILQMIFLANRYLACLEASRWRSWYILVVQRDRNRSKRRRWRRQ